MSEERGFGNGNFERGLTFGLEAVQFSHISLTAAMDAIFVKLKQIQIARLGEPCFAIRDGGIEERTSSGFFWIAGELIGGFGENRAFGSRGAFEPVAVV